MKIAVLGTGTVGRVLAGAFASLGHQVTVGTRDVEATMSGADPGAAREDSFAAWAATAPAVRLATFAQATADADVVVNATNGAASLDALRSAGEEHLAGRVLLDVANPLDFSAGFPPSLFISSADSLAEQIQRAFPSARVVKSLNTVTASLMVRPHQLADGQHTVFVSGDDADAKALVNALLTDLGHTDVIDLGDITTARGPEHLLPLWLRLMGALGTPLVTVKVVR